MSSLLRVESLFFAWKAHQPLLSSIYLDVAPGEIIGLIGRNGSGKSSLFHCLTRGKDWQGSLFIRDQYLPIHLRHQYIACLPQECCLPGRLTVTRLIRLWGLGHDPWLADDQRLQKLAHTRVAALSSGERRYLEFLLVMGLGKTITILDEPFSQVEPLFQEKMYDRLSQTSQNQAIIIADHDFTSIKSTCHRLVLLEGGRLSDAKDLAVLPR